MRTYTYLILLLSLVGFYPIDSVHAQDMGYERDRHRAILQQLRDDVKKYYYDPNLKGIDIDANLKAAEEEIRKSTSSAHMKAVVAQFLADFDDSHLFFLLPRKAHITDYGFELRMIGDKCYVVKIDGNSDAAKKGMDIGDTIFSIEGFVPIRRSFWKFEYFFYELHPLPKLKLVVIKPDGRELQTEIAAKISRGTGFQTNDINQMIRDNEDAYNRAVKQHYYEKISGLFVWKMPWFSLDPEKVDGIMNKAKNSALILDLRGNSGGRVDMLLRLISNFFPEDLKVYDEKRRKETKEVKAKSRKQDAFDGKVVVLIDSRSASASEVFSKVIQLERRGIVIGDSSAGAVMESRFYGHASGVDVVAYYGVSITIADLIMKDGKSLEKVGVTPDERLIPTAKDLAARRDIVLARAVELLGFKMSAEEAGKVFPNDYEPRR